MRLPGRYNRAAWYSTAAAPQALNHKTAAEILSDPGLSAVLAKHNSDASSQLPSAEARLDVIKYMVAEYGRLLPSNEYLNMRSASDAAAWYSRALQPDMPSMHARQLLANALEKSVPELEEDIVAKEKAGEKLSPEHSMPSNLILDPRTFQVSAQRAFDGQKAMAGRELRNRRVREQARKEAGKRNRESES